MTADQPEPDPEIVAIRNEMSAHNPGSPAHEQARARHDAWWQAKYPPSTPEPEPATPKAATPAPSPAAPPATIADLRTELVTAVEGTRRYAELMGQLEAAYKAMHGADDARPATTTDPTITALETELRDMKPNTAEWAAKVDAIDALVRAQPVRAEDLAEMQGAADGIALPGGEK
jgi:hypothetical protein